MENTKRLTGKIKDLFPMKNGINFYLEGNKELLFIPREESRLKVGRKISFFYDPKTSILDLSKGYMIWPFR